MAARTRTERRQETLASPGLNTSAANLIAALESIGIQQNTPREPGEFTVAEAAQVAGLSVSRMYSKLKEIYATGKLLKRCAVHDGKNILLYRPKMKSHDSVGPPEDNFIEDGEDKHRRRFRRPKQSRRQRKHHAQRLRQKTTI